jgi:hypothetical protein
LCEAKEGGSTSTERASRNGWDSGSDDQFRISDIVLFSLVNNLWIRWLIYDLAIARRLLILTGSPHPQVDLEQTI